MQAACLQFIPGKPFSLDNYRSLQIDSVCEKGFPPIFGIQPASLTSIVPTYLVKRPARSEKYSGYRHLGRRDQ